MVVSCAFLLAAATSLAGASAIAGATIANSATEAAPASVARGEAEGCDADQLKAVALIFISPSIDFVPGCLPVVIY